jgi:hypothetical protein
VSGLQGYDARMSAGKKVAMGCGGILVLILLAGGLGVRWVYKNYGLTMDPEKIRAIAAEILPVEVPEPFQPVWGQYTEKGLLDPLALFQVSESRTQESSMLLYSRAGTFSREDMFADISAEQPGLRISVGVEEAGEDETFEVTYQGNSFEVLLQEGLDEDQVMTRVLVLVMPLEDRTVVLLYTGEPQIIDRDLMQRTLDNPLPPASVEGAEAAAGE